MTGSTCVSVRFSRAYFTRNSLHDSTDLFEGKMFQNKTAGKWNISLAMRLFLKAD